MNKIERIERYLEPISVDLLIKLGEIKQALREYMDTANASITPSAWSQLGLCQIVKDNDEFRALDGPEYVKEAAFLNGLLHLAEEYLDPEQELTNIGYPEYYFEDNDQRIDFLNLLIVIISEELCKRHKLSGMEYIAYPLPEKLAYVYCQIILDYLHIDYDDDYLNEFIGTCVKFNIVSNRLVENTIIELDASGIIDWKTMYIFSEEIGHTNVENEFLNNMKKKVFSGLDRYSNEELAF